MLLKKLDERFFVPDDLSTTIPPEKIQSVQVEVLKVVALWLKSFFYDFNKELLPELYRFLDKVKKNKHGNKHTAKLEKDISHILKEKVIIYSSLNSLIILIFS